MVDGRSFHSLCADTVKLLWQYVVLVLVDLNWEEYLGIYVRLESLDVNNLNIVLPYSLFTFGNAGAPLDESRRQLLRQSVLSLSQMPPCASLPTNFFTQLI